MKTSRFFIATLLVAAAVSVAVVSCKKETPNALLNNKPQSGKTFSPPKVDDMNAYLKDFKQKMQNVTRDENETLSLEEAAWHLSSVANYDFANANVSYTDLRHETIYGSVIVENGRVSLSELNRAYLDIANKIDSLYQSVNQDEKHFRFINASISNEGNIVVNLILTYVLNGHLWYFPETFAYADSVCAIYFDYNGLYRWNTDAITVLENALNSQFSLISIPVMQRVYYVPSKTERPLFLDHSDPYGSPFDNYRIFNTRAFPYCLSFDEMCYCLDSYLGLGQEFISDPSIETIVSWEIDTDSDVFNGSHLLTWYHVPVIEYGIYTFAEPGNGFDY